MMTGQSEFELRSANGVRNVECDSRIWNGITVRHIVNHADRPGKVWHDISSTEMTVAVLLEQVGGFCETRFDVNRPTNKNRFQAGQIDVVPPGTPVWGYSENLRSTRGLRLYLGAEMLETLIDHELDRTKSTAPQLMLHQ
jgi:hypothetical protein